MTLLALLLHIFRSFCNRQQFTENK